MSLEKSYFPIMALGVRVPCVFKATLASAFSFMNNMKCKVHNIALPILHT